VKKKSKESVVNNGIEIINLPHLNSITNKINGYLVNRQIGEEKDICITFIPSPSLKNVYEKYNSIFYYCVHDTMKQGYSKEIIEYEKELVKKSKRVFCDNEEVLSRLAMSEKSGYSHIFQPYGKFILVPPPVPNNFFKECAYSVEYDFVYFGSIHKDIDIQLMITLSKEYKILLITNEKKLVGKEKGNFFFMDATSDLDRLVGYISTARFILLPYKNSSFMETVSPAKIYQSMATGKPIFSSNKYLTKKYNLNSIYDFLNDSCGCIISNNQSNSVKKYSTENIIKIIEDIIKC
jgi:hypothetical protein